MPAKKTNTASKPRKAAPRKAAASTGKRPVRREVWSVVCFFLSVFSFLGLVGVKALFIDFFVNFAKGIIGAGYIILPFLLLAMSAMLLFHRGRPVRLRVLCCLAITFIWGACAQLFFDTTEYTAGLQIFGELYGSGMSGNGGVLTGLFSIGFEAIFSKVGAAILLIAGGLILVFIAFRIQIILLWNYLFARERPIYDASEKPEPVMKKMPAREDLVPERRAAIDIPSVTESPEYAVPEKKGLLRKRPVHVVPPDEVAADSAPASTPEYTINGIPATVPVTDAGRLPNEVAPPSDPVPPLEEAPVEPLGVGESDSRPQTKQPNLPTEAENIEICQPLIEETEKAKHAPIRSREADTTYNYPTPELLDEPRKNSGTDATEELKTNAVRLTETIKSFGIEARIINVTRGPSVTRYELELDKGVKLTRLTGLSDDIALSLGSTGVRIAPIPDKVAVVGIEVPNKVVSTVFMREIIESKEFSGSKSRVSFAVGRDIGGESVVGDISRLPHLLIAGTTGSGKSVCMNSLIVSLLYKASPDEVRLIMIDPKMIELNIYNGIPHLLIPVVTDPKKAAGALQWAVNEMMKRYKTFSDCNVRDFAAYNNFAEKNPEYEKMPQIVILIDELADLMLVAAKEVEEAVCRIAQMARAAGMHLVIATQSPRADVITGIMKANIPSRIAFAVASQLESRIIMDTSGAEKLVGKGDMLYFPLGSGKPTRIQGCFISSAEVERVVGFVKENGRTEYSHEVIEQIERAAVEKSSGGDSSGEGAADEMLPAAVDVILETGQASVSMLQRRLKLGYARAARLVDQMEQRGIVGPFEGAKPRQMLITREQWEEMKLQNPSYQ